MKATIDAAGRIVVPKPLRQALGLKPGQPLEPKVKEFLKLVLSREGQDVVAKEQVFIPLLPQVVQEELKKLD